MDSFLAKEHSRDVPNLPDYPKYAKDSDPYYEDQDPDIGYQFIKQHVGNCKEREPKHNCQTDEVP
jgi:hypothetical protein